MKVEVKSTEADRLCNWEHWIAAQNHAAMTIVTPAQAGVQKGRGGVDFTLHTSNLLLQADHDPSAHLSG